MASFALDHRQAFQCAVGWRTAVFARTMSESRGGTGLLSLQTGVLWCWREVFVLCYGGSGFVLRPRHKDGAV